MAEHTSTPWIVGTVANTLLPCVLQNPGPVLAELTKWASAGHADPYVALANADFIVLAVNNHEELRAICETILPMLRRISPETPLVKRIEAALEATEPVKEESKT